MNEEVSATRSYRVIVAALIVIAGFGGGVYLAVETGVMDRYRGEETSPMHVEEFRVAEPLDTEAPDGQPWETITAVTEPYDDVEAAMDDEPERLASGDEEVELQCRTVLKEMAFCTGEDSFLDIIGTASNLQSDGERQRFMERVQHWFEPGGATDDCRRLLENDEIKKTPAKRMWAKTSQATGLLCDDFGELLLEAETFTRLGVFWEEDEMSRD